MYGVAPARRRQWQDPGMSSGPLEGMPIAVVQDEAGDG
jgi:hypothetical protein